MALGVLHAAHRIGRRVPEELSVVGVDNIAEASHFWPPLTTVYQPLADAGVLAVKAIDQQITRSRQTRRSHEPLPEMTLLRPELIIRESSRSGPPVHFPVPRTDELVLPATGGGRTAQLSETAP